MSSKVVKSGTAQVDSIQWQRIGAPMKAEPHVFAPPVDRNAPNPDIGRIQELETRIRALEREIEHRSQAAFQKGVQQGEAQARQAMSAALDAGLQKLARMIEELSGIRQRCRHEAEEDVVKLSLAIARRILRRELTIDSDALLGLVKAALDKVDVREVHRIQIHPDHAGPVRQHLEKIGLPRKVEVIADPALENGALIFETTRGTMDASAETQIAEIERGFTDLVRHT